MPKNKRKSVLASVFDKKGISKFAKTLYRFNYKIISTDGTGRELTKNGIPSTPAQNISKNPNGLDDCIKTISFRIEAGILFNRLNPTHLKEAKKLDIEPIDIVICNFPPFEKVIQESADFNVKNIDIGGPLMVRAAATNFEHVLVIVDPNDYEKVAKAIIENRVTDKLRRQLAAKAFTYTYLYDYKIAKYLRKPAYL